MSSCQIDFVHECREPKYRKTPEMGMRARVFRKYDGSPSVVTREIMKFISWNKKQNLFLSVIVANFIFWSKLKTVGLFMLPLALFLFGNTAKQGFEVFDTTSFHPEISFFYEVIYDDHSPSVEIRIYRAPRFTKSFGDLKYVESMWWTPK